jgi:hypothetical protein
VDLAVNLEEAEGERGRDFLRARADVSMTQERLVGPSSCVWVCKKTRSIFYNVQLVTIMKEMGHCHVPSSPMTSIAHAPSMLAESMGPSF